jgi:hypothetical protein
MAPRRMTTSSCAASPLGVYDSPSQSIVVDGAGPPVAGAAAAVIAGQTTTTE